MVLDAIFRSATLKSGKDIKLENITCTHLKNIDL